MFLLDRELIREHAYWLHQYKDAQARYERSKSHIDLRHLDRCDGRLGAIEFLASEAGVNIYEKRREVTV